MEIENKDCFLEFDKIEDVEEDWVEYDEDDWEDEYEYDLKTDQTVEILESLGFEWVKPDTDYLTRVIGYLNDLEFFN